MDYICEDRLEPASWHGGSVPFTLGNLDDLRAELKENLGRHPLLKLEVSAIDLEGVKLVIQTHKDALGMGKQLEFTSHDPAVGEALEICRWFSALISPFPEVKPSQGAMQ